MNTLQNLLEECTQKGIIKIVVSNPRKGEKKTRIEIRPFEQKGTILYTRRRLIKIIRYIIKTEQERN